MLCIVRYLDVAEDGHPANDCMKNDLMRGFYAEVKKCFGRWFGGVGRIKWFDCWSKGGFDYGYILCL